METDEEVRNEDSSISKHNKNIIYNFLSQSIVCSVALIVIWIAFIIECIMTWINNSGQSYGIQMIDPSVLIDMGGNVPLLVNRWQIYRIFTATLLHAGILHIGMNTLSLIGFCAQVEFAFSKWIFIIVYIVGGIQGNLNFIQETCSQTFIIFILAITVSLLLELQLLYVQLWDCLLQMYSFFIKKHKI